MPTERLLMRQIREILRLRWACGLPQRAVARACGVGLGTVSEYCRRAAQAGLSWPLPDDLDDRQLEARLFQRVHDLVGIARPLPDMAWLHQELKRPGVTLQRLWLEYLDAHPDGYRYSQFCRHYERWVRTLAPTMRQVHRAGEKAFVDFSGQRPVLCDPKTGELVPVELFIGVLGASNYTYAEACLTQDLPSWISAHVRMLEYFQGSPAILVPDNLRSGVTRACRYEPMINRTYLGFARHYGLAVVPARSGRPRDKAPAEAAVLVVQRWILAALRHRRFFHLAELNAAIRELSTPLNDRPMKKLGVSRRDLFERLDRPALRPLPPTPYEFAVWTDCGVNIDYHIEVAHNYYSVPYQLVHQRVEARLTATTVEVFLKGRRIASHRRLDRPRPAVDPARAHAARPSGARGVDAVPAHRVGGEDRAGHRAGRVRHPRQPAPSRSRAIGPVWACCGSGSATAAAAAGGGLCAGRPTGRAALPHGAEHLGHRPRAPPARTSSRLAPARSSRSTPISAGPPTTRTATPAEAAAAAESGEIARGGL